MKMESNSFAGSVFIHKGQNGHLMNQHYLETLFCGPSLPDLELVSSEEPIVEMNKGAALEVHTEEVDGEKSRNSTQGRGEPGSLSAVEGKGRNVEELSRLWMYKDGHSP